MSIFHRLTERPTGHLLPDRPPLMVMETDTTMSHLNEYHVEVWRMEATFHVEYAVPHADASSRCHEDARIKLAGLILRDYYEEAQRVTFALYELRKVLPTRDYADYKKELWALENLTNNLVGMLAPDQ